MSYVGVPHPLTATLHSRTSPRGGDPYPSPTLSTSESMYGSSDSTALDDPGYVTPSPSYSAFDPFTTLLVHHGPTPHKGDMGYQHLLPPSPVSTGSQAGSITAHHDTQLGSPLAYEYSIMRSSRGKKAISSEDDKSMYIHAMPETPGHPEWSTAITRQEESEPALYPHNASPRQTRRRAARRAIKIEDAAVSDQRKHLCSQCGRSFSRRYNLAVHLNNVHSASKQKPNICPVAGCNMKFVRKTDLTRHEQSVHARTKPFGCKDCNATFARKDTLKRHQEDGCVMRKVVGPSDNSPMLPVLSLQTEFPRTSGPPASQNTTVQWADSSQTVATPILAPAPRRRNTQSPIYGDPLQASGSYQSDPYSFQRVMVTQGDQAYGYPSATLSIASEDRSAYYYNTPHMDGPTTSSYLYGPLSSTTYTPTTRTATDYIKNEYLPEDEAYTWQ